MRERIWASRENTDNVFNYLIFCKQNPFHEIYNNCEIFAKLFSYELNTEVRLKQLK